MNILDILIICILLVTTIYSFIKGFIRTAFSIGAIIGGLVAASRLYPMVRPLIGKYISSLLLSNLIAFFLILLITAIGISLIGRILHKLIESGDLGWADRLAGIILGMTKGLVIIGLILIFLLTFIPPEANFFRGSHLLPYCVFLTYALIHVIPAEAKRPFKEKIDSLILLQQGNTVYNRENFNQGHKNTEANDYLSGKQIRVNDYPPQQDINQGEGEVEVKGHDSDP